MNFNENIYFQHSVIKPTNIFLTSVGELGSQAFLKGAGIFFKRAETVKHI